MTDDQWLTSIRIILLVCVSLDSLTQLCCFSKGFKLSGDIQSAVTHLFDRIVYYSSLITYDKIVYQDL